MEVSLIQGLNNDLSIVVGREQMFLMERRPLFRLSVLYRGGSTVDDIHTYGIQQFGKT